MKIGIIGLGSIGQRHVKCLKQLGYKDIIALRTKKGIIKELPKDLEYIREVFNYNNFFSSDLDGIIISNPTSFHVESMKKCLSKNIPIFVEKPIAGSLDQILELKDLDTSKVAVGFNYRYNEAINATKEALSSGKIGKIYKADLYCGQYLPSWHSKKDYRKEYYSRKDLGGGALRTLSHEIDLMQYFFGNPVELSASIEKISDLEIDVEDNVYIICKTDSGSLVNIELDYLNPIATIKGDIFGSNGKLTYSIISFSKSKLSFIDNKGKEKILYENHKMDWNKMYMEQMKNFVNFIKNKESFHCAFKDGVKVMEIIKTAEKSKKTKTWQKIVQEGDYV